MMGAFERRFRQFESSLNGEKNSTFHQQRIAAMESLQKQGFPSIRNEEYKYTPLLRSLEKAFPELPDYDSSRKVKSNVNIDPFIPKGMKAHILVFVNGVYYPYQDQQISNQQLSVSKLSDKIKSDLNGLKEYFGNVTASRASRDSFELLNAAFSQNGIILKVEDNHVIQDPVFIINIADDPGKDKILHTRNQFLFGKNSQATIIESFHTSGGEPVFTNTHTDFHLKSNSNVKYIIVGRESSNTIRVSSTKVNQDDGSVFSSTNIDLGGKMIRNNLSIEQNGEGCETNMYGLFVLSGHMHVDNHTSMDHKRPNCQSNELYKGILDGNATGVFNGKIFVRQDAQKTNAFQQNSNILLSEHAKINTKPQLEIWADDVKCSHGCTTGQIDGEQIFYLRSRGLDLNNARAMLLYAFAKEVLDTIQIEPLKNNLDAIVFERLKMN